MSLRQKATSGLVWTFAQQFGNQVIVFIVSVILARILLPAEFGLIGMIAVFIAIGNVLLTAGLSQSLIRTKELDQCDYSTVFYFTLIVNVIFFILIYISAPSSGDFYKQSILSHIIPIYAITFIISPFGAVQFAKLTKEMNFRTQPMITIPSTVAG